MTKSSESSNRFEKPGPTRDFTRAQFDLIQSSHEWEKLRSHAQRLRELEGVDSTFTADEETRTPTGTPTFTPPTDE